MHKLIIILAMSLGVVQAQTPFQRGDGVRVLSEQSPAATAATVEAVPADRVEINSSGIYINDVAVTRLSAEFTAKVDVGELLTVPAEHYFVVGESRSGASVSRYWALIPADKLERTD